MCGISGVWNWKNQREAEEMVMRMNLAIAHRGPDAEGIYVHDSVVLGHRRLSIIDTSAAGNQPFYNKQRTIALVFNGELYNYKEIRDELKSDYEFLTRSDTEVLIAAYEKWGIRCIDRFIGMFGFALFDSRISTCYIVRDRLGKKPIYYASKNGALIFASELRAVLESGGVERKLNESALSDYLLYQTVHAPKTIIEGVQMIMPGHYMELKDDSVEIHAYWDMIRSASKEAEKLDREEVKEQVARLLRSSIELRMRADVSFGAFLSGGIDSTAVVGLMSERAQVKTFSITFKEQEYDEGKFSRQVAEKFDTIHTPIELSATDFLQLVPDTLNAMDHPGGDGPNTYVVSKVTRATGVKMVLSGLGGDELFAGYDVFRRMADLDKKAWLNAAPRFLRQMTGKALTAIKPSIASEKIAETLGQTSVNFESVYPIVRSVYSQERLKQLLKQTPYDVTEVNRIAIKIAHSNLPLLSKVSAAEMSTYMQNVLLRDSDQMSMAHALEIRVPFIDHRLVEFMLGVNDTIKYPHTPKQLMTESLGDLVPHEVIHRPKMGFTFPWAHWMRNELKSLCEEGFHELKKHTYFKHHALDHLWNKFLLGDPHTPWSRVWHLVVLGYWMKKNKVS